MDNEKLETHINQLKKRFPNGVVVGVSPFFEQLDTQLSEYFAGDRKEFDVVLDMQGTDFQIKVWQALLSIPYGKTVCYQEQALVIKNPKAVRAVANANGANRIAIVIPCHKVIGKNGSMVGYGGGIWRKEYLLKLEADGAM